MEVYDSVKVKVDDEDRDAIIQEAARRDPRIVNFLDMVPGKVEGIGKSKEFLLVPVYETRRGERIAKLVRLKTRRRIRLDDYGWMVWKLIDGKRDVRKIGEILKHRYGKDVEPLYPRISKFMAYLQNLKLLEIDRPLR
jgi:coenzyme PQQ synthesis protein D (PqqD)